MPNLKPIMRTKGYMNKPNKPLHATKNSMVEGTSKSSDAVKALGSTGYKRY